MLTIEPSRMATPEPSVTASSVSRPRTSVRLSGAAVSGTRVTYLLAQVVRPVGRAPATLDPLEHLLPLRMAHQPHRVTGTGQTAEHLERLQLRGVRREMLDAHPSGALAHQRVEVVRGATAQVTLLVPDHDHVGALRGDLPEVRHQLVGAVPDGAQRQHR